MTVVYDRDRHPAKTKNWGLEFWEIMRKKNEKQDANTQNGRTCVMFIRSDVKSTSDNLKSK